MSPFSAWVKTYEIPCDCGEINIHNSQQFWCSTRGWGSWRLCCRECWILPSGNPGSMVFCHWYWGPLLELCEIQTDEYRLNWASIAVARVEAARVEANTSTLQKWTSVAIMWFGNSTGHIYICIYIYIYIYIYILYIVYRILYIYNYIYYIHIYIYITYIYITYMCIHDYICMYTYVWVSLNWSNFDLGVPLDDPPWAPVCTSPTPAQVCCHLDQQQTIYNL